MLKASGISSSRSVRGANRSMSLTWSTNRDGPAMRAAMSGKSRPRVVIISRSDGACPVASGRSGRRGKPRLYREVIILSNATILPHAAFGSGPDDGGAGFGAHGHAARHPWARGDHPQTRGHESARSRTRGRGFGPAGG